MGRLAVALTWILFLRLAPVAVASAEEDLDAARAHYRRAATLYDLRRYREAAKEFEAAFEAKDDPAFLYNIAQSYRLAGESSEAVGAYQSFLRRMPKASNRREVQSRITELNALLEQQRKTQQSTPTTTAPPTLPEPSPPTRVEPPPVEPRTVTTVEPAPRVEAPSPSAEPSPRGRGKLIAGGLIAGAGVALIVVGAIFGAAAASAGDELTNPKPGQRFDPSLEASGQTSQGIAIAALSVGAVAIAAGSVLLGLGVREHRARPVALSPVPLAGGAGLVFAGSF